MSLHKYFYYIRTKLNKRWKATVKQYTNNLKEQIVRL